MRWPKYWSFSFSSIPSKEIPGLMSFRKDWLDLLAVQGTLKSLLQHHSSKASILWCSAFFTVQLSYPYMTTGEGKNTPIWERRLYLLQWPYSALYWQNITEPAKVKYLLLTSQSRPRGWIGDKKQKNYLLARVAICLIWDQASQVTLNLWFSWFIFFCTLNCDQSAFLYLKCISFR